MSSIYFEEDSMTEHKHTPGPWVLSTSADDECEVEVVAPNSGWETVSPAPISSEANAHLIAAAPEMLDALESAEQFIQNGIELGYIAQPDPIDSASQTLPKIKKAIAKAKDG